MERRKDWMDNVWTLTVLVVLGVSQVVAQQQSFKEPPVDTSVIRGQTATLKCIIANKKGELQWTKNGFALGFDRSIPGFPNYRMIGTDELGEYNLMIEGVTLDDDAEFQCQVLPGGGDSAIRASAHLQVLIPPGQPVIVGYDNGTVVKVPHRQDILNLTCMALNGKPAAELSWIRNGVELTDDQVAMHYSKDPLDNKKENAQSVLSIIPSKDDNDAYYTCICSHPALREPLLTTIQLSVMHPPMPPEITGYNYGQVVNTGDTLELKCIAYGGNPLAQVYWYKNDEGLDFSYHSGGNSAENPLAFTVQPNDNEAVYRCEASNLVTDEPLVAEVKLIVQFAPTTVTISGQEHAKAGERIKLKCVSAISNPPAIITWFSRGRQLGGATSETTVSPQGGFITSSEIEVTLTDRENDVIYQCHATNDVLGKTVVDSVALKVVYPPDQPTIAYTEGEHITAGEGHSMTCQAIGGNPLATLTWYKGDHELEAAPRVMGNIVSSQVSFLLKPDDNGAEFRCNATNPATVEPLSATTTLNVNFPPKFLNVSTVPARGRIGEPLLITCRSASSNPQSKLSWSKNGAEINNTAVDSTEAAEYGGVSSISRLEIIPTSEDDAQIYACQATNKLIRRAVSDAVTLDVMYPPVFGEVPTQVDIIEYHQVVLNLTASGNPSDITYTWYRDNQKLALGVAKRRRKKKRDISMPLMVKDGGILNITNITRHDAGNYVVESGNSQGKKNFSIFLNVQYPAEITRVSQNVLADQDDTAVLECVIDANPLEGSMVTWSRTGYDMTKTSTRFTDKKSLLSVANVTKEDSGLFTCTANNGIGTEDAESTAQLIVKFAPEIDQSPTYGKAAADKGSTATLICKAEGAPSVEFFWFRNEVELDTTGTKYATETKKTGLLHYESLLKVYNTTKAAYGQYRCEARNPLGSDSRYISLDGTSKPDPPFNLRFVNATHNAITLSWQPGFDGGSNQWFQVRYSESGEKGFKYEDVVPQSVAIYTVRGLKLATSYEMTLKAVNRLGESTFYDKPVIAKTSAVAPSRTQTAPDDIPLIIILTVTIIGLILLGLNVLLILFFIRRRRKQMEKDASESTSQANTLEMFNAPTITEDSKSYTTYDRRSFDDYQDDIYKPFGDDDEMRRFLGPGGYPPDYPGGPEGYYPPTFRNDYDTTPGYTNHMGYPPMAGGNYPPDGIYMDDKMGFNEPGWDPKPHPHEGPYGSLPRGPPSRIPEEEEDYTDQLRKMQQSLGGPGPSGSQSHLPPPPPPVESMGRMPPPPPARSTSKGPPDLVNPMPPLPTRNYAPEDVPRYTPAPGSAGPAPDMKGHLV